MTGLGAAGCATKARLDIDDQCVLGVNWHSASIEFPFQPADSAGGKDRNVLRRDVQISRRPVFDFDKPHDVLIMFYMSPRKR